MSKEKKYLELPSIISKDSWFFKENEKVLTPYIGVPYLSYSSHSSYNDYFEDFIKRKIAGIKLPFGIYATFGTYIGEAMENGEFSKDNPEGFTGQENLDLTREEGVEYEKFVLIDRGNYIIIGFIDIYKEEGDKAIITDVKSGGNGKEVGYKEDKYIQTTLYGHAIEQMLGKKVEETYIRYIRREGSHVNPPLHISDEQFTFSIPYNNTRVNYALKAMDKTAKEVESLYKTFNKYFKTKKK